MVSFIDEKWTVINQWSVCGLPVGKFVLNPILWIVVLACLRYGMESTSYQLGNDSLDYVNFNQNVFAGETDARRTPLYPLLIKFSGFVTRETIRVAQNRSQDAFQTVAMELQSGEKGIRTLVLLQKLIFILALLALWQTGKKIVQNQWFLFAGILMICHFFYSWQWTILTEGLSISFTCFFFALIVSYLLQPSSLKAFSLGIFVFLMIMLRPAFAYLAILLTLFWLLCLAFPKNDRRQACFGLGGMAVCMGLLLGYCQLNQANFGVFALTNVGKNNQFYVIEHSGFFRSSTDRELVDFIERAPVSEAYRFEKVRGLIEEKFGRERLEEFTSDLVSSHPAAYVQAAFRLFWAARSECGLNLYVLAGAGDFMLILWLWLFLRRIPWIRLTTWGLFYGLAAVVILNAPTEYDRLFAPAAPIVFLICVRAADFFCIAYYEPAADCVEYLKRTL